MVEKTPFFDPATFVKASFTGRPLAVEAYRFAGVDHPKAPERPPHKEAKDWPTDADMRIPYTRAVSMHFSDGRFLDVQEEEGQQFLDVIHPSGQAKSRVRAHRGDWVALFPDGSLHVFSDAVFTALFAPA